MVAFLMMSKKLATLGLLKLKVLYITHQSMTKVTFNLLSLAAYYFDQ